MLEFLLALVIGAFLFAVFGVIALLGKTKRLAKELEELKRNVRNLSCELSIVKDPNLVSADWRSLSKEPSAPPAPETGPLASAAPPTAVFAPVTAAPWPEPAARVEPMPKPAAQAAPSAPETPAPESGAAGGRIAAFIRGGSVWAAGGVLLLIAAFAMLMTYMARRGFFTLEMR
ncbi:MAG: hypothetical protein LBH35_08200, partial [Treponema sp.]|nr:hypothetical protein [Treponema sp.]